MPEGQPPPHGVRRPATSSSPELAARLLAPAMHGAQPQQVARASLAALLCLALLAGSMLIRSLIAAHVSSPLTEKLAHADRVAYYVLPEREGERVPSFRLGPGDTSIKLITHMVLPVGHVYAPDEEFAYGIRLSLCTLEGEVEWTHELNIRTRQSKSEWDGSGWRLENAFILEDPDSPDQPRELSDDRLTRVRVPAGRRDRLLRLSFVPREPSTGVVGLARAYVRRERPVDERTLRELSLAPEIARELVDHLTYRNWEQLSEQERRTKLRHEWHRLAAEGEVGLDYELLSIYETGFRLPRHAKTDEQRLVVDATRSLAVNVIGPTELELELFGPPALARAVEVIRYGLDGSAASYASSQAGRRTLEVPEGVHTLIIACEHRLELTLEVAEAGQRRVWLIEADRPRHVDEDGHELLEPDLRRIEVARVGEAWRVRPRWAVAGPADPTSPDTLSRMFRFDLRVVYPTAWSWSRDPGPSPDIELCFFDAEGRQQSCERWTGEPAVASKFEGLRMTAAEEDRQPIGTRWYPVSEPQTLRVIAPEHTARVELRAAEGAPAQRLLVRGYGYWPEVETTLGEPFRSYVSNEMVWRYPPLETRTWFPLRPVNYDDLQDDEAVADLLAQVRLQPRALGEGGTRRRRHDPDFDDRLANELAGEDGWDSGPWTTLDPRGRHRRRLILERLDAEARRRLAHRWSSSLFTELRTERSLLVGLGDAGPGAPELHWQVDPRTLGRSVRLSIDGRRFEHRLAETRGRWRLPMKRGRHRLTLELDAARRGDRVWIDRPVLDWRLPVSRRRIVHKLSDSLVFPLIKPGPEALTVNLVVYLPRRRERAELALNVDGGRPQRRTGVPLELLSVADRSYTIDTKGGYDERDRQVDDRTPIRFVDLEAQQGGPLDRVTLQITLGEDVVAGRHEVRVELLDGGRVWVRAFHRGIADRSKPATSWSEPAHEPGEVEG